MASCQDDDDHCPMMALDELNKTVSRQMVLGTFSDLIQLYDKNNYSCHHEGHHLGMWLYDYTRNLKEALNYATLLCGGSVYHGIFQSYFGGEQFVHNVDKNQIMITHLRPMGQENVNWRQERDCIHGIGDGLVKLYNYNTTAAVDCCNEFRPRLAQSAFSRGIFMENNDYFFETGKGDFDKYDIYSPCNRAVEKFAPQCYYYHPEYASERNNLTLEHNLTYAFAQCDNISPDKFAKYRYQRPTRPEDDRRVIVCLERQPDHHADVVEDAGQEQAEDDNGNERDNPKAIAARPKPATTPAGRDRDASTA